jgi:HK97 family phage portal protein
MSIGSILARMLENGRSAFALAEHPYDSRVPYTTINVHDIDRGDGKDPSKMSLGELWATQPHLRTVIDFRARNVAKLGVHVYQKQADNGRVRVTDDPIARTLAKPNDSMTGVELIYDLVATKSLYDKAYWFVYEDIREAGRTIIQPFNPDWVTPVYDSNGVTIVKYRVQPPGDQSFVEVPVDQTVVFRGWNPASAFHNTSPVESLREVLAEQYHSRKHRIQLWKRNGRVGTYITRPADAPSWTPDDRRRFYDMFEAFTGDKGPKAGGAPLLEDGMSLNRTTFTSADEQWLESVKLSLHTVAQVYQVSPVMVGDTDATSWSNVREFNRQLYTNSLGWDITSIEDRINEFVIPLIVGYQPGAVYAEFNVEAQLRGSFEEQSDTLSKSVGGPWMTRSEARALMNMPHLDEADELIVPKNVSEGGAASPQDGGDGETDDPFKAVASVMSKTLDRQRRVYSASKNWNEERWHRELVKDLQAVGVPEAQAAVLAQAHNASARAELVKELES